MRLISVLSICVFLINCSKDISVFDRSTALSIRDFWQYLDQNTNNAVVVYGRIIWISADYRVLDISDGNENITIFFQTDVIKKNYKKGQAVYVLGTAISKHVQKGRLDRFIHNAYIEGRMIMRK